MAGTTSNRGEEFARVSRSEKNNYYSGGSGSGSPMKPGFGPGKRNAKDPNNASSGTAGPTGGTLPGNKAKS